MLEASSPGVWGNLLRATVNHLTRDTADTLQFNLLFEELDKPGSNTAVASEQFRNVSVDPLSPRFVDTVVNEQSALFNVRTSAPTGQSPTDVTKAVATISGTVTAGGSLGSNGNFITDAQIVGSGSGARNSPL